MSNTTKRLNELIEEINTRKAKRVAEIKRLETEANKAENTVNAADAEYTMAKNRLDADKMIAAGVRRAQAEEILKMFYDKLDAVRKTKAYTYDEVIARYQEFNKLNDEVVDEANKNICILLAQIDEIIRKADVASESLNDVFNDLNQGVATCGTLTSGLLARNLRSTIAHTRQHFSQYWPK